MRPVPPVPSHGPTPSMPDTTARHEAIVRSLYDAPSMPSTWVGSRAGAQPITHQATSISSSPQERERRRQGNELGNNRAGPVREVSSSGWVWAPKTSHISRFKLDTLPAGAAGPCILTVVFKGPPTSPGGPGQGEVAEYVYYAPDEATGNSVFDELRRSPHPYGFVLTPRVINAAWNYHPA